MRIILIVSMLGFAIPAYAACGSQCRTWQQRAIADQHRDNSARAEHQEEVHDHTGPNHNPYHK